MGKRGHGVKGNQGPIKPDYKEVRPTNFSYGGGKGDGEKGGERTVNEEKKNSSWRWVGVSGGGDPGENKRLRNLKRRGGAVKI